MERVNNSLQHLLSSLPAYAPSKLLIDLEDLRGAPMRTDAEDKTSRSGLEMKSENHPDIISNYTGDFLNTVAVIAKLFKIHDQVRICYWLLFATVGVGVVELLALPIESARPYISLSCYPIVGFQLVVAFMIRVLEGQLERFERTS